MTRDEMLMVAFRTENYPLFAVGQWSSQPCQTRGDWLKWGCPFAILAAIRDDLGQLVHGRLGHYSMPGFLRAKSEICAVLGMDAWRFVGMMHISPREVARRLREAAER